MYNFSNSLLRNILKFQNVEISHTRCFYFVSKNVKYSKLLKTCHHQKLKMYNVRGLQNTIKSKFICCNFLSRGLNNRLKLFAVFLEDLSRTICISVMILKTAQKIENKSLYPREMAFGRNWQSLFKLLEQTPTRHGSFKTLSNIS